MRSITFAVLMILALGRVCPRAIGQAVTEYGLGAGRAATTTAPARNAANGIAGVFDNLSKAAGADSNTQSSQAAQATPDTRRPVARSTRRRAQPKSAKPVDPPPATTPAPPATPAPVYEDARLIPTGIEYDEMVRRFGPPSMMVTTSPGVTTLWYSSHDTTYQIEVKDGKVVAAPAGASAAPAQ